MVQQVCVVYVVTRDWYADADWWLSSGHLANQCLVYNVCVTHDNWNFFVVRSHLTAVVVMFSGVCCKCCEEVCIYFWVSLWHRACNSSMRSTTSTATTDIPQSESAEVLDALFVCHIAPNGDDDVYTRRIFHNECDGRRYLEWPNSQCVAWTTIVDSSREPPVSLRVTPRDNRQKWHESGCSICAHTNARVAWRFDYYLPRMPSNIRFHCIDAERCVCICVHVFACVLWPWPKTRPYILRLSVANVRRVFVWVPYRHILPVAVGNQ